jgi:hypothetical protein
VVEGDGDVHKNGSFLKRVNDPVYARISDQGDWLVLEGDGDLYENGTFQKRLNL